MFLFKSWCTSLGETVCVQPGRKDGYSTEVIIEISEGKKGFEVKSLNRSINVFEK